MNTGKESGQRSSTLRASDLVLGVDGGGTKTVAWLAPHDAPEESSVIGRGTSAGSNVRTGGIEFAVSSLNRAIDAAFADAGIRRGRVASVCLSMAGCGREAERSAVNRWARHLGLAQRVTVTDDALPILYAATPDGFGIALVAGTGSLALGRDPQGMQARSGGWGPLIGDEGSGYQIALTGIRAAARSADGRGPNTALLETLLSRLDLHEPSELIPAIHRPGVDRAAIAQHADLVFTAAEQGDAVAAEIVQDAAKELAGMVAAVARRLEFGGVPVPLTLSGGVLLHRAALRTRLFAALNDTGLQIAPLRCVAAPVAGAVRLAAAQAASSA